MSKKLLKEAIQVLDDESLKDNDKDNGKSKHSQTTNDKKSKTINSKNKQKKGKVLVENSKMSAIEEYNRKKKDFTNDNIKILRKLSAFKLDQKYVKLFSQKSKQTKKKRTKNKSVFTDDDFAKFALSYR